MKTVTIKEIQNNWQDLIEFKYNFEEYKKDTAARNALNSAFGCKLKAAFCTVYPAVTVDKTGIDFGAARIIFITEKGDVRMISSSEWGGISNKLN
ncbi:hypothetical protein DIDNDMLP_00178 [Klebsiella phage KP13-7]|nr:hypothetical protein DIDNDMLP_00178 [Klebsiella phage KP13-7]